MVELIVYKKKSWGVIVKKFNPNKNIIISLIIAIIVVAVVSVSAARRNQGGKTSQSASLVNDAIAFVDKGIALPGRAAHSAVSAINTLVNTYQENERLKSRLDNYDEALLQSRNQKKEIEDLKKELKLNATLTNYTKVTANVITRSPDTWQDVLVIDKGKSDGISVNMAVMSQYGLVGRIVQVNTKSAKVELLTTTNQTTNHFPVRVSNSDGDAFGLIKNYDQDNQTFVINQLTGNSKLKEGDIVQTSGLGGNSPANLLVGTVIKVKANTTGLDREVYVKPAAQMYDISVVTVVKRVVEEGK
jgi:rod shape-determining protein MreC